MRKIRLFLMAAVVMLIAVSCGTKKNDQSNKIKSLEDQVYSENYVFDKDGMAKANDLLNAYISYADSNKDKPEAPGYLFKAADLAMNLNQADKALELYNRIYYEYPDYEKAPECLFLMGYVYENYLQNFGKAKEIYEEFIKKYPDNEFTDDAKVSIDNLGKSPEELIKQFEEQNQEH